MSEDFMVSTDKNEDPPESIVINSGKHYDLQNWIEFTNLKCIKEYKNEELDAFKQPFLAGWKRELSIRAQLHSSGKRIVDVYYISPCNQTKLKSYIELGFYLKNDQERKLEPENFTFAKQPVYKYPEEIIKQVLKTAKQIKAEQIKQNHVEPNGIMQLPQLTPINDSTRSGSDSLNSSFDLGILNNSVAEGRSKRKRTAPTRFDDEDYLEQTLTKKKLVKTPPITPSTKVTKSNLTPFSPKSLSRSLKEIEANLKQENNSEDRESISSFKSSRSTKSESGRSEQIKQNDMQSDSNLLINEINSNLKDTDDADSNLSNKQKDENSQDQLQTNQTQTQPNETSAPTATPTPTVATNKPTKSKSKKKSAKSSANNELSILENSLLMETYNTLGMNNLLQNGNFECEDNDLSDCEFVIDTKITDDLPIPPCSLICAGRKGDFPNLLCSKCLCLFHPQCVKNGVFLKDTKQFVCPNCIQPEDQSNAHEDTNKLFEEPPDLEEQAMKAEALINQSTAKSVKDKSVNQLNSKQSSKTMNSGALPKMNGNPEKTILKKKSQSSHQQSSTQIRLPPQLVRSLSSHPNMSNNHSKKINHQPQQSLINPHPSSLINHQLNLDRMHLNQQQQRLMKQNQFNSQLFKKLNQYSFHQQNLINLRSSLTQLANGTHSNSSIASRQTHLDNMNKTLLSSQQVLDSIKKHTTAATRNPSFYPTSNRDSTRLASNITTANKYLKKPTTSTIRTTKNNPTTIHDEKEMKFINYLNQHQNGLKQMINQYEALDKIFDYLTVPDLIQCKLVNSTFKRLANEKHHWKSLNLKGLAIRDWQYFASEIVYNNQAKELCLEGLRSLTKFEPQEDDLWKNFRSCFKFFQSINKISFGKISIQNLQYLLNANDADEFNPLYDLEELSIKNLYDDQSTENNLCSLNLLKEKINEFKNLSSFRIESKQGISNDENTIDLLNNLSEALPKLRSLYLPSLKSFSIENFEFLTKLNQLECLEIGSCESWTSGEINETTSSQDDEAQMERELLNEENRLVTDEDDEFMNENQENEFNHFDNNRKRSFSTSSQKKHQGAFKYLSQLKNLRKLYLTDVIIDEMSNQLPLVVEKMANLESLGLGYVTVSPDATQTLNMLCNTLKNKLSNLKQFSIETDDPHTNRCAFDLLLRLDNLDELRWKVHTQVEDDGNCLVPFVKERGIESDLESEDNLDLTVNNDCIEMVETCYLNDVLQRNLKKTKVFILPQ